MNELIVDILSRAIDITVNQKQDVSYEFYPLTKVLTLSIHLRGKGARTGLTRTWAVNVEEIEALKQVQEELMSLQNKNSIDDDFLE